MSIDFDRIDPHFIDCDFPADPHFVLGELRPDDAGELYAGLPTYEDSVGVIPTNEWIDLARATEERRAGPEFLVTRIYDQRNEGSCVANMKGQQHEVNQAKQHGRDRVVPLSAISLYKRIGRSPNSGSLVSDAATEAKSRGFLPLDTAENRERFKHVMPATGFYTPFPDGWEETARLFCDDETYVVRSYEGLVSAMLRGETAGVGRAGHSILYCGTPRFATSSIDSIRQPYPNSWGNWGVGLGHMPAGFGFDTYRSIRQAASYAIVVRSVVVRSETSRPPFETPAERGMRRFRTDSEFRLRVIAQAQSQGVGVGIDPNNLLEWFKIIVQLLPFILALI